MPVTEDTLTRARKHDRRAMEAVLADAYPLVFRLAHGLTGRPGAARQVVHDVLRRSLRVMPKWRAGVTPENWFYHHTVITSRAAAAAPPEPHEDVLVRNAPPPAGQNPAYVAFVRALRQLPPQQAEAFILQHGEKLNTRLLGVAMDCSQDAAAKHLEAANSTLAEVAGGTAGVSAFAATVERAYGTAAPPQQAIQPAARKYVTRHLRPRRLKRVLVLLLIIALAAAGLYAWQYRDRLVGLLPGRVADTQPTTQPSQ